MTRPTNMTQPLPSLTTGWLGREAPNPIADPPDPIDRAAGLEIFVPGTIRASGADPFVGLTATAGFEDIHGSSIGAPGADTDPGKINDGNDATGYSYGTTVFAGHTRLTWMFDLGSDWTLSGVPHSVASYQGSFSSWWLATAGDGAGQGRLGGGTLEYADSSSGPWTRITGLSDTSGGGDVRVITFDAATARYWRFAWYLYATGLTGTGGMAFREVVGDGAELVDTMVNGGPNATDGDDATYVESSGTHILDIDLEEPRRIVRARLFVGTETAD